MEGTSEKLRGRNPPNIFKVRKMKSRAIITEERGRTVIAYEVFNYDSDEWEHIGTTALDKIYCATVCEDENGEHCAIIGNVRVYADRYIFGEVLF